MGTRSLTKFIETSTDTKTGKKRKDVLTTIYRQMDGYPSGMGADLADFLAQGKLVNGISMSEKTLQFNGMGCLAAQVIANLKQGAGGIYIEKPNARNCGEEYIYHIIGDFDTCELTIKCFEVGYMSKRGGKYINKTRELFSGDVAAFSKFCNKKD